MPPLVIEPPREGSRPKGAPMTLLVSFAVIVLVAALVGRSCARAKPGDRPGAANRTISLDSHHSGWSHARSHDSSSGGD